MASNFARPYLLGLLNGIFPCWKYANIDENELIRKFQTSLLKILAIGTGCRVKEEHVLHNRLPAIYRTQITGASESFKQSFASLNNANELLRRYKGHLTLNPSEICAFDESAHILRLALDKAKYKTPFHLQVDSVRCVQIQNTVVTLEIECKPTYLLPHLFGKIQTDLKSQQIVLKNVCRTKLGPFHQRDCLTDDEWSYEKLKNKLKQTKIMHPDLIEDFYTNDEWRLIGT